MAVDDRQDAPAHILGDHAAGHLSDGTEGHVVDEDDIQVRLALGNALVEHAGHDLVDQAGLQALRIVELADGIVHLQGAAPGSIRDRAAQELFKLGVGNLLDIPGRVAGKIRHRIGKSRLGTLYGYGSTKLDVRHRGADKDLILSAVHLELVGLRVEVTEGLVIEGDGHGPALAGL